MREILKQVRLFIGVFVIAMGIVLPINVATASADGAFIDIGVFQPSSININGEVAGSTCCYIDSTNNEYQQAVMWSPNNGLINIPTKISADALGSEATGINNEGQVVGEIKFSNRTAHAFTWTPTGGVVDLGTLGGAFSYANAVSNNGVVVGHSESANGSDHAFMWTSSTGMVDLGTLGGGDSTATAINNNGEIVGDSYNSNSVDHAFSWTQSTGMVDLGALEGPNTISYALGVNDNGVVVGGSQINSNQSSGKQYAGVYWSANNTISNLGDLGVLGFTGSQANAINNNGEIVGNVQSTYNGNFYSQPFSWTPTGGPVILPGYQSDFGSGTKEIANAIAINDNGVITGNSLRDVNGFFRTIIWGPLAETGIPLGLSTSSPTRAPNLNWSTVPNADSYNIYRDGVNIASSADNSYADSNAPEGDHSYYVTANNSGVETGPSNTINVLVDRTSPTVGAATWSANPLSVGTNTTLTVPANDTSSGVLNGEYYLGTTDPGQGNGTSMTYGNGNLSAIFGSNLTSGIYTVNVRARDNAGNWSGITTDYLVVYNPSSGGIGGHSNTMLPIYGTDVLPGLIQSGQSDIAGFALTTKYDSSGNITSNSKLKFSYSTGAHCNNASQAINCHSLSLDSTSISWLVIGGANNSQGTIQGVATVTVDGVTTTNPFSVTGVDGALLNPQTNDTFTIKIFAPGANPNTTTPIYHLNVNIVKGSIKIT